MKETELRIRIFGDPVLRKKAAQVKKVTPECRAVLTKMAKLMYDAQGIGLAAPQVGVSEAMIVVDIGQGLYKVINPRVTEKKGSQVLEEGCLSVPGVCIKVKRALTVTVQGLDQEGEKISIKAEGLLACVFQHEIEHLYGKMIVDHASFLDKVRYKQKLAQLEEISGNETVPESKSKSCELQL